VSLLSFLLFCFEITHSSQGSVVGDPVQEQGNINPTVPGICYTEEQAALSKMSEVASPSDRAEQVSSLDDKIQAPSTTLGVASRNGLPCDTEIQCADTVTLTPVEV